MKRCIGVGLLATVACVQNGRSSVASDGGTQTSTAADAASTAPPSCGQIIDHIHHVQTVDYNESSVFSDGDGGIVDTGGTLVPMEWLALHYVWDALSGFHWSYNETSCFNQDANRDYVRSLCEDGYILRDLDCDAARTPGIAECVGVDEADFRFCQQEHLDQETDTDACAMACDGSSQCGESCLSCVEERMRLFKECIEDNAG